MDDLQRVDHITLAVANIEATLRWYTTSFNCRVVRQDATYAEIEFENLTIALSLPSQESPHLAFVRPDAQTFGRLAPARDGRMSLYVSDPAGNLVELLESDVEK